MNEITLQNGDPVSLQRIPMRKFRGLRLPGGLLFRAQRSAFVLHAQEYQTEMYAINCYHFQFQRESVLHLRDHARGLRLEAILMGELVLREPNGNAFVLRAGQYHITSSPIYQCHFHSAAECNYVSVQFSPALIENLLMKNKLTACSPRWLPPGLNELIFSMLQHPYTPELHRFFYDTLVRQISFQHLASVPAALPDKLTDAEVAAIHSADNLIASNLGAHLSIRQLARHAGTNEFTLKQGFRKLFGVGPFERLMQRRMQQARTLLESTDKPIKEIAELAGYSTLAGFITGFRRRYGVTPRVWRQKARNLS